MGNIQEKVDNWIENNQEATESDFFEWLQGTEYCGSEVEDCGQSGQFSDCKLFEITFDGETEEFYLDMAIFYGKN